MSTDGELRSARLLILGAISELPMEQRERIGELAKQIRAIAEGGGEEGALALSLVSIEVSLAHE